MSATPAMGGPRAQAGALDHNGVSEPGTAEPWPLCAAAPTTAGKVVRSSRGGASSLFPRLYGQTCNRPAGVPKRSSTHEIEAEHPRFWSPPGLGKSLDGWLYAASIAPLVGRLHALHRFELIDAHFAYPDGFAAVAIGRWLNLSGDDHTARHSV